MINEYALFAIIIVSIYGTVAIFQYFRMHSNEIIEKNEFWYESIKITDKYKKLAETNNQNLEILNYFRELADENKPKEKATLILVHAIIGSIIILYLVGSKIYFDVFLESTESTVLLKRPKYLDNLFLSAPLFTTIVIYIRIIIMQRNMKKYKNLYNKAKNYYNKLVSIYG